MMKRGLFALLVLAACNDNPPFTLRFRITDGDTASCISPDLGGMQATSCDEVKLPCRPVISIRIFPPANPQLPYISVCEPSPRENTDACAIAGVNLPQPVVDIPEQRLEAQISVYADYTLPHDDHGNPICPPPSSVLYGADGFPATQVDPTCRHDITDPNDPSYCWPIPALGGVAYYTPGDTKTVVELGCTNTSDFTSQACLGTNKLAVNATVNDFDLPGFSIPGGSGGLADRLALVVGEPHASGDVYVMNPSDVRPLARENIGPTPTWGADLDDVMFQESACIQVREEIPLATPTITCKDYKGAPTMIDQTGFRLAKATLDQIIKALDDQSTMDPPVTLDKGLVIGLVLDDQSNPAANHVVVTNNGSTIEYLSADRGHFVTGGTSSAGIFLSRDAPYGTTFTAPGTLNSPTAFGGLVAGKVSIVVLQFPAQGNMP